MSYARSVRRTTRWPLLLLLSLLLLLLLCASDVTRVRAVKFAMVDTQSVCFVEDVPARTDQITGIYTRERNALHDNVNMVLELRATYAETMVVHEQRLVVGEHSFAFAMHKAPPGSYRICARVNDAPFRATLDTALWLHISIDHTSNVRAPLLDELKWDDLRRRPVVNGMEVFEFTDYGGQRKSALQPRAYLQSLEDELNDIVTAMINVNASALDTLNSSQRMRDTSESTFTRVWVCALLVMAVLAGTVWTQFHLLRRIIVHKKLV